MNLCKVLTLFCLVTQISFVNGTIYLEKPNEFNSKIEIVGCFLEYQDKILLLHRQEHKMEGNRWGVPGGKLEKMEAPLQGILREVFEETGFDLSHEQIVDLGKVYIIQPNFQYIYHMMKCTHIEQPGNVKITFAEHKGFTWVTPSDALKMHLMTDEDACIELIYNTP